MVTAAAGQLRPLRFDNLKGTADKLQLLRHVAAQRAEVAAARRTGGFCRRQRAGFAGKRGRQRLAGGRLAQRLREYRVILLTQHLSHLLLQGADALLRLAYLPLRFLAQLFGVFAELHALQLSDQRLQAVDFAGVRRHPLREQTVIFRHFADGRLLLLQQCPEPGIFIGV